MQEICRFLGKEAGPQENNLSALLFCANPSVWAGNAAQLNSAILLGRTMPNMKNNAKCCFCLTTGFPGFDSWSKCCF
jgi:hypothetical protein